MWIHEYIDDKPEPFFLDDCELVILKHWMITYEVCKEKHSYSCVDYLRYVCAYLSN